MRKSLRGLELAKAEDPAVAVAREKFDRAWKASFHGRDASELMRLKDAEERAHFELHQAQLRALFERIERIRRGWQRLEDEASVQLALFQLRGGAR